MALENIEKEIVLHNGISMPRIGFGCAFGNWTDNSDNVFFGFTPEVAWQAVPTAISSGYRLLDCALLYGTHNIVGQSIGLELRSREHIQSRSDLFIVSKVFHGPAPVALNSLEVSIDIAKYLHDCSEESLQAFKARIKHDYERSLAELNIGYLDLLLMHWPGLWGSDDQAKNARLRKACWEVFEDLYLAKRVRAIGVSNFLRRHLEEFFERGTDGSLGPLACRVLPMVNQIEVSPYLQQREIVSFCKTHGIVIQAWGPFGSGATGLLTDGVISEIGRKHGRNNGQIILRWLLQHGLTALPKSLSAQRMKANLEVFDFELDEEDMTKIDALERGVSSVQTADDIA